MAADSRTPGYPAMVAEAEAAVSSVKDPELRRVAFDRILQSLLDATSAKSKTPERQLNRGRRSAQAGSSGLPRHPRGPKAFIETLIDDAFFRKPRTIAQVKAELANRGHHVALTSLSGPLQRLTQERRLRRQKMPDGKGTKGTYAYSNW